MADFSKRLIRLLWGRRQHVLAVPAVTQTGSLCAELMALAIVVQALGLLAVSSFHVQDLLRASFDDCFARLVVFRNHFELVGEGKGVPRDDLLPNNCDLLAVLVHVEAVLSRARR